MPSMRGRRMSLTMMPRKSGCNRRSPSSALPTLSVGDAFELQRLLATGRTSGSSSMMDPSMCRSWSFSCSRWPAGNSRRMKAPPSGDCAGERAAEIAHDAGRDGHAEARANAGFLGRIEGSKRAPALRRRAGRGRAPRRSHAAVASAHRFDARRGMIAHRVERVADQVDHDLFEPVGVALAYSSGCSGKRVSMRGSPPRVAQETRRRTDDLAEIDGIGLPLDLCEGPLSWPVICPNAVDKLADAFEVGARRRLVAAFEEAGGVAGRVRRAASGWLSSCDAGRELADDGQLAGLTFVLRRLQRFLGAYALADFFLQLLVGRRKVRRAFVDLAFPSSSCAFCNTSRARRGAVAQRWRRHCRTSSPGCRAAALRFRRRQRGSR